MATTSDIPVRTLFAGIGLVALGMVAGVGIGQVDSVQKADIIQQQRQQFESLNAQMKAQVGDLNAQVGTLNGQLKDQQSLIDEMRTICAQQQQWSRTPQQKEAGAKQSFAEWNTGTDFRTQYDPDKPAAVHAYAALYHGAGQQALEIAYQAGSDNGYSPAFSEGEREVCHLAGFGSGESTQEIADGATQRKIEAGSAELDPTSLLPTSTSSPTEAQP